MERTVRFKRFVAVLAVLVLLGCQPIGLLPGVTSGPKDPVPVSSQDGGLVSNNSGGLISNNTANLAGLITGPAQLVSNNAGGLVSNNAGGYRVQALETSPVANAVVYLTTPNEQFYAGDDGKALYTFTDSKGAYAFKAAPAEAPVIVTVLLPGNRRLVGFLIPKKGENAYDVDLATTVVTEFLRDQARLAGKSMADYPALATELPTIIGLTRTLIAAGEMRIKESETDTRPGYVDLNVNSIPAMRAEYVRAFAASNQALSDAWKRLLGYRPLLVDEVEVGLGAGMQPIAVTTVGETTYTAAINAYQLVVTRTTGSSVQTVLRAPRSQSKLDYVGGMTATGSSLFLGVAGLGLLEIDAGTTNSEDLYYDPTTPIGSGSGFVQMNDGYYLDPNDDQTWTTVTAFDVATHGDWFYVTSDGTHEIFRYKLDADRWATDVQKLAGASLNDPGAGHHDGVGRNFFNGDATRPGSEVALNYPTSATTRAAGGKTYLYFADTDNHRIRRIDLDAAGFPVETVLGRGTEAYGNVLKTVPDARIDDPMGIPQASASLNFPHKVVFDGSGRMFVADTDNRRIRMLEDGKVKTIAGSAAGGSFGTGDSRRTELGEVSGLAFDAQGNLLIADTRSNRLRRLRLPFGF